ncbi:MAG: RhtB family transporter [Rhodospirillum sp.]|nr:RhtB family transporter [Rhodospirillum sp.]
MFDMWHFILFLSAAGVLALMPGPGIFYVAARTLAGGRGEGLASSFGTGLGGFVHIIAGAIGVSAIVMASAEAFTALKIVGAFYLVYLGITTWREAGAAPELGNGPAMGMRKAFKEGVIVEALNPKTAAFFLAFLPQFVVPSEGHVWLQFIVLGTISVFLNTTVDVVVTYAASAVRDRLAARPAIIRRMRQTSGAILCALGVTLALAKRPA